jgi:hypothetical protein
MGARAGEPILFAPIASPAEEGKASCRIGYLCSATLFLGSHGFNLFQGQLQVDPRRKQLNGYLFRNREIPGLVNEKPLRPLQLNGKGERFFVPAAGRMGFFCFFGRLGRKSKNISPSRASPFEIL